MTMSHHIFTSGGAAHDVKHSVAPASVSFAILDTTINVSAYTDEDTTDTVNPFAPAPPYSCEDPLPVGPFRSQEEAGRTMKQYALPQVFAVSIVHTRSRGVKRVSFCCSQGNDYHKSRAVGVVARPRN